MEKLTLQEEEVMGVIWQIAPCCVKDILQQLPNADIPYTTVASIVKNLEKKGYVSAIKEGKTFEYHVLITKEEFKSTFMKSFIHRYFKNSYKDMVAFFAKEEKVSSEELKEIIDLIEKEKEE